MKKNPDSRTFGLILVVIAVLFFGFFGHDMLYFFSLLAEVDIFVACGSRCILFLEF